MSTQGIPIPNEQDLLALKNENNNNLRVLEERVTAQLDQIRANQLDVKNFGATGLGVIDDADAINRAIAEAGKDAEVVMTKGKYYIKTPIRFKNHAKIRFEGAEIITDDSFIGEAALYCDSADANDGVGNGYLLNPNAVSTGTDALGVLINHCKNFFVSNLKTTGYLKGGIQQKAGYELILNGFNILAPKIRTREFEHIFVSGIYISTTDAEVSNGTVYGYPVGVRTLGVNHFCHVHCWGLPSTGAVTDRNIMLYPFLAYEKNNSFVNCYADTPDVLDITLPAGGLNGGIGFYDCNSETVSTAFPIGNSYVNCRVALHPSSVRDKIIGFNVGDKTLNNGSNEIGRFTKIIAPTFSGTGTGYYKKINIENKKRIGSMITVIDPENGTDVGVQTSVTTSELRVLTSASLINAQYISKIYKQIKSSDNPVKIFDLNEIVFFTVDNISLTNNNVGLSATKPAKVSMTSDGTVIEKVSFIPAHVTANEKFQIAKIKWYGNLTGDIVEVFKDDTGWYIQTPYVGDILLEITCKKS